MRLVLFLRLFVFVCILFAANSATASVLVNKIAAQDSKQESTLILHYDGKLDYNSFSLENPYRFVIDIKDAKWNIEDASEQFSENVKRIRHGFPKPDLLRIVLDLRRSVVLKDALSFDGGRGEDSQLVMTFSINDVAPEEEQLTTRKEVKPAPVAKRAETKVVNKPVEVKVAPAKPAVEVKQISDADATLPASMRSGYGKDSPFALGDIKMPFVGDTGYENSIFVDPDNIPAGKPIRAGGYKPIIILDPGHGGMDPGAIGKSGVREKDVTLRYSKDLRDALLATGRYRVHMTRDTDKFIALGKRVKKARSANGDLLISIHADAHANPKTRGFSVYTLSENRAEREGKKLERKASKEEVLRGVDLSDDSRDVQSMLIDMAQRETSNISSAFAQTLVKHMGKEAKLLRNPHRFKSLAVLTGADLPSVLVELGYLSNNYEERLLKTDSHRKKLVKAIVSAIDEYVEANRM